MSRFLLYDCNVLLQGNKKSRMRERLFMRDDVWDICWALVLDVVSRPTIEVLKDYLLVVFDVYAFALCFFELASLHVVEGV